MSSPETSKASSMSESFSPGITLKNQNPSSTMITANTLSFGHKLEKLRIIKPFEEKQLLNFYRNPLLDANEKFKRNFAERFLERTKDHNQYFNLMIRLEKSIERFKDVGVNIGELVNKIRETENKCWKLTENQVHQSDRCGDGQIVESSQKYNRYHLDQECFNNLERFYYLLRERLVNEHIVHSYFQKYFQLRFELVIYEASDIIKRLEEKFVSFPSSSDYEPNQLSSSTLSIATTNNFGSSVFDEDTSTQMNTDGECNLLKEQLLDLLSALFCYYRRSFSQNEKLKAHCYQTIMHLCQEMSKIYTFYDRLFLLNLILRCPAGSSRDFAPLIEPLNPLPLKSNSYELGRQYVDYGVTCITTILSPIKKDEKDSDIAKKIDEGNQDGNREWLLIDNDLEDEVIDSSLADLTEDDFITYLSRVPFREILQFMSLINETKDSEMNDEQQESSIETSMIRLFAFNTKLIQIFRDGLQNFNCLRFKRLTLYLASMVKQIIKTISDNWHWCKEKFTTKDQALLIRLQVEFDHFMLRSIMAILSTNRRGVWPLLAKIDFEGISEPMLWHILWVVYNNGRNEQKEMATGLCPYMSANYWKDKFRTHVQWKYVFIEKLSVLSLEEASGFIDFFYNMAISRGSTEAASSVMISQDSNHVAHSYEILGSNNDFLREIIERIGEICLLRKFCNSHLPIDSDSNDSNKVLVLNNQEFYSTKGVACLIKLVTRFKSMLVVLMQFIQSVQDETNLLMQPCFDLFTSIVIDDWKPEPKLLSILYKWLLDYPSDHIYNRFARILLTKIGWNRIILPNDQCLMIPVQQQQTCALKIFQTLEKNFKINENANNSKNNISTIKYPIIKRKDLSYEKRLAMAQSDNLNLFGRWCWSMLLSLRLHPLDLIPDESCWDDIIHGNEHQDGKYAKRGKHWTMQHQTKLNYDSDMICISRGIEKENPYAIYIGAIMSDLLFSGYATTDVKKLTELCQTLAKSGHFIPILQLLYHFLPFSFENDGELSSNSNLVSVILTFLQSDFHEELGSILLLQKKHFSNAKHSKQACQAWTEILFECINKCLNFKSPSWITTLMPQFLFNSSSSLSNVIDSILTKIAGIFDKLAMELLCENNQTLNYYLQYLIRRLYGRMLNWKLIQLDSISNSSSGWLSGWYSNETPINYLADKSLLKSPWMTPFHLLLRHCLNVKYSPSTISDRQPIYLAFLLTEADIRRTHNIWTHLIMELNKTKLSNTNDQIHISFLEAELAKACQMFDKANIPTDLLPISLITVYLLKFLPIEQNTLKIDCPHPLIPLLWRQFFSLYFLFTDTLSTISSPLIDAVKLKLLNDRLNALFDYHNQRWIRMNNGRTEPNSNNINENSKSSHNKGDVISSLMFEDRLLKLYRAYRIWLKDERFTRYAYLDDEQFDKPEIQVKLLNSVVSISKISNFHRNFENLWPEFDHINSFFFSNYVNKSSLMQLINHYERRWIELIKSDSEYLISEAKYGEKSDHDSFISNISIDSSNEIDYVANVKSVVNKNEYTTSDQFRLIIDYFSKLTSTLNCNILFLENDLGYIGYGTSGCSSQKSDHDISVVFVVIHQIVDNIVEEARFLENQLEKFSLLNQEFLKDVLPKLFHDVTKDVLHKVSCDRAEFDVGGCTKPAVIKFEYVESILNTYIKQKYDRNRTEIDSIITSLVDDLPGQKVVASIYFMQKLCTYLLRFFDESDPSSDQNHQRISRLFETMSGWMNSINLIGIKYHITGQLLDIFLDMLNKLSNQYIDQVNYFYLNTALQRSVSLSMTQHLAPCLTPSKTSPMMFIEMYKLIGSRLSSTSSQQTIFVLLSKFDVSGWLQLQYLTDEQRLDLLNCLFECFAFFGPNPNDEFLITYDLYRKHLQDIILFRFPLFMQRVVTFMLQGMTDNVLAPALWNSILHTFGFYTKSLSFATNYPKSPSPLKENADEPEKPNEKRHREPSSAMDFDFQTFDNDLRTYLLRQKLFTSHELYDLLQIMIEFKQNLQRNLESEFLDHFKIYNVKYLQFLTFISYCWINSNSTSLSNDLTIIWLPFFENWKYWIFPKQNTKFIQWEHFCFAWQLFINCVQFMLDSFYDGQSQILSSIWNPFMNFILETRSVEQTEVEMFEAKLLQLNDWSQFYPSMSDMKLMYESVLQDRYSVERLNSFVISKIKWNHVLLYSPLISIENAVEVLDNLTYTIISLADQQHIAQVDFQSIPFFLLPTDKVKKIVLTLLEFMKKRISIETLNIYSKATKKSQISDGSNQVLIIMQLLKSLVELNTKQNDENEAVQPIIEEIQPEQLSRKSSKVIYYGHCIGSFVSYVCSQNVDYLAKNSNSLLMFLKDSIESLRPTIDVFASEDRVSIFCEILQSLNEISDIPVREKLATYFITIFSYVTSAQMIAEIMFSIGKIIYSIKTSVYLLENLIVNYFDLSGDLNYLVDNLEIVHLNKHLSSTNLNQINQQFSNDINSTDIEDFIMESIKTRSCLLLLIYIHRRLRHRTVPDICTRRYVYTILAQCTNHFKFGNSQINPLESDEAKICFFWVHLFDLMTFDHSSIDSTLNVSIHHLSSLKPMPATFVSQVLSTRSLLDSPIIYSQIASTASSSPSPNRMNSSPSSSLNSSMSISHTPTQQLSLDIHQEDVSNAIHTLMLLCRSLNNSISESMNRGFFGMFRQQKPPSPCCLFLLQSLVLHGASTMLETFFPPSEIEKIDDNQSEKSKNDSPSKTMDSVRNKLKTDLIESVRVSKNRLRGWKKNKSFQEFSEIIDKILDLANPSITVGNNSSQVGSNDPDLNFVGDEVHDPLFLTDVGENDSTPAGGIDSIQASKNIHQNSNQSIESMTKQWLRYYIRLSQYQQKRFQTIRRWLLEFYPEHNFMKNFG